MLKSIIRCGTAFLLLVVYMQATGAERLYFVDAHSQIDHQVVPLQKVVSLMEQAGVSRTILSTRGRLKDRDLLALASAHAGRIIPALRTKGEAYESGSAGYYKLLARQASSGRFSAMAEVLLYHAQKGRMAPEVVVSPEDKRVRAALKHAIRNGWPFVVHIEFAALTGEKRGRFMASFERLLSENPQHPFVLTHLGQLKTTECHRLIEAHHNLHFHTGWTNPAAVHTSNQPWTNVFEGKQLVPEWRKLMLEHPERFVFALDNVFPGHWSTDFYLKQMTYWRAALTELPMEAAHLIAHGNAERLWRLPPGP